MIKSINQLITERCNSRCQMCSIWSLNEKSEEMKLEDFDVLYSKKEFKDVEDLCISGGEPTLRGDLIEIVDKIISHLPKLRMLFLSTNGSNPELAEKFVKRYAPMIKEVYVCPSLEGDKQTHKLIRGVDTYAKVIETAKRIISLKLENVRVVFSMTIVPTNCNKESLDHVMSLSKELGCSYSFRPASKNDTFYHNRRGTEFMISKKQLNFLKEYMRDKSIHDRFLDILFKYLAGEKIIMGNKKDGIKCLAGNISIFIKPDGQIYPCINSSRKIGDKDRGIYSEKYILGDKELCPCCTECQIYPMLNFSSYAS